MSDSLQPHGLQHTRLLCLPLSPGVYSNSCTLSQWCYLSHPLLPSCPFAFNLSQHQGLFQWDSSLHQVAKVLELQHQSFQWILRTDFLWDSLNWSCSPRDSQESFPAPQFESINSLAPRLLYGPTLISVCDDWEKNIALTIQTFVAK